MSITDDILRQYADKRANKQGYLEGFQARQGTYDDIGYENGASNYLQLFSQGGTNLLKAIDAPNVRSNLQREEMMKGEQLQNQRDQEAAKLEGTLLDRALNQQQLDDDKAYRQEQIALDKQRIAQEGQRIAAQAARDAKQDSQADQEQQLKFMLNTAAADVTGNAIAAKQNAAKLMGDLNGVDLTTDAAGNFVAPSGATDVIKSKVAELNQANNFSVSDYAKKVASSIGSQVGGRIDPMALSTTLVNTASGYVDAGNKEIDKRVTASDAIYDRKFQDEQLNILTDAGIQPSSFSNDFLGDKDLTASGELNKNYFNEAFEKAPGLKNADPSVYANATEQYNEVRNSPEVVKAIKEGRLSEAMLNKAAGNAISTAASTANWWMNNTLNIDLKDQLSSMLPELEKFTSAKKAMEDTRKVYEEQKKTAAQKQRILAYGSNNQ